MALLASVTAFAHFIAGLTNKGLRAHMAALFQPAYSSAHATYDLRRLRLKGFICRLPGTNSYRATAKAFALPPFSPTSPAVSSSPLSPTSHNWTARSLPSPPASPPRGATTNENWFPL